MSADSSIDSQLTRTATVSFNPAGCCSSPAAGECCCKLTVSAEITAAAQGYEPGHQWSWSAKDGSCDEASGCSMDLLGNGCKALPLSCGSTGFCLVFPLPLFFSPLSLHCASTVFASWPHCRCLVFPLPLPCVSTVVALFPLPLPCVPAGFCLVFPLAFVLCCHCRCLVFSLPLPCGPTAFALLSHCLCLALSLPSACASTAFPPETVPLLAVLRLPNGRHTPRIRR